MYVTDRLMGDLMQTDLLSLGADYTDGPGSTLGRRRQTDRRGSDSISTVSDIISVRNPSLKRLRKFSKTLVDSLSFL